MHTSRTGGQSDAMQDPSSEGAGVSIYQGYLPRSNQKKGEEFFFKEVEGETYQKK